MYLMNLAKVFLTEKVMSPAKESMLDIIGRQPDDSTYDEILRKLVFARIVQRGLEDAAASRTRTAEKVAEGDAMPRGDSWACRSR